MVDTIKFGLSLWLLTYIGAWFNALTLVILAWVGLFTLPKVYVNNQAQVDSLASCRIVPSSDFVPLTVFCLLL